MPRLGKRKRTVGVASAPRRRRKMTPKAVRAIVRDETEKSEPKVHRLPGEVNATLTHNATDSRSVVEIAQGVTSSTRVGVKARVARLYVKGQFFLQPGSQQSPMTIRWGLDIVKDGIVEGVGVVGRGYFAKPDYVTTTKRVLMDKTMVLRTAGDGDMDGPIVNFAKMMTLKTHECRWDTASANDPSTGNILLWYTVESPIGNLTQGLHAQISVDVYYSEI